MALGLRYCEAMQQLSYLGNRGGIGNLVVKWWPRGEALGVVGMGSLTGGGGKPSGAA